MKTARSSQPQSFVSLHQEHSRFSEGKQKLEGTVLNTWFPGSIFWSIQICTQLAAHEGSRNFSHSFTELAIFLGCHHQHELIILLYAVTQKFRADPAQQYPSAWILSGEKSNTSVKFWKPQGGLQGHVFLMSISIINAWNVEVLVLRGMSSC